MYRKLIKNDMKNSKTVTAAIALFIMTAALFTSVAASLIVNLFSAIDNMMAAAQAPHFMQMHSGRISEEELAALEAFAGSREDIEAFQILPFLNIEGENIIIGGRTLAGTIQDNGVTVQSEKFDFLRDLDGEIVYPEEGQVYVPVFYMEKENMQAGQQIIIQGLGLTVAGFVRDSFMNPELISSKRFLINEKDFERLYPLGAFESLIEFRTTVGDTPSGFESAYLTAGLPADGPPAATYALFKAANAITDGIMIAVLILISMLITIVVFLCIRLTIMAKIEEDYREIGVLKAIGLRVSGIKKLYLAKYGLVASFSCLLGYGLSLLLQKPFLANIRLYMGDSSNEWAGRLIGIAGSLLIFGIVLLYINGVLNRFRKISASQAIRFGAPQEAPAAVKSLRLSRSRLFSPETFLGIKDVISRKKLYLTMLLVLVISTFILVVPRNIYDTISSRNFMSYSGVGVCDIIIGIEWSEQIREKTAAAAAQLSRDASVDKTAVLIGYMFDMVVPDGPPLRVKVTLGDHDVFPIEYTKGRSPASPDEIAISVLNASELEKGVGDEIILKAEGEEHVLTVCGIYSDITDGGKTAKALFSTAQTQIRGSSIMVIFKEHSQVPAKVRQYRQEFTGAEILNADDQIEQAFGDMTAALGKASYAAIAVAAILTLLITLLFMKMLIAKDRHSIAVLKVNGFTSRGIRKQYLVRSIVVLAIGVLMGTILANTLGEYVGAAMISSFGAATFHFDINPLFAYLFSPALIIICVYTATVLGAADINRLRVSEFIKE